MSQPPLWVPGLWPPGPGRSRPRAKTDTHLSDLLHGRGLIVHLWATAIGPRPVFKLDPFVPVHLCQAKHQVLADKQVRAAPTPSTVP